MNIYTATFFLSLLLVSEIASIDTSDAKTIDRELKSSKTETTFTTPTRSLKQRKIKYKQQKPKNKSKGKNKVKISKKKKPKKPEEKECLATLSPIQHETAQTIKRTAYGGLQFNQAIRFLSRQDQQTPLSFQTTNFLWYAWQVALDQVSALEEELPDGFALSKIAVKEGEEAAYYIVLNLYNVVIADIPAIRAEWSTFVTKEEDDEDGASIKPYFMILDAPTNTMAFEPTSCIPKNPFDLTYTFHESLNGNTNGGITASLEARGGNFTSSVTFSNEPFLLDESFQTASTKNYWLSGIYDRGFFNGDLVSSTIVSANEDDSFVLNDTTYWSTFTRTNMPQHTFYYLNPVQFILNPWFNLPTLMESNMDLYTCLDAFKYDVNGFAGLGLAHAQSVTDGMRETMLNYRLMDGTDVPSIFLNFRVKKKKDVKAMMSSGLTLSKIGMSQDTKADYMITLRITKGGIVPSESYGLYADWITYVQCGKTGRSYQMVLDGQSDTFRLDAETFQEVFPVDTFQVNATEDAIRVNVSSTTSNILLAIDLDHEDVKTAGLNPDWLYTHDRVYATNGLYDSFLADAQLYDMQMVSVPPSSVKFESSSQILDMVDLSSMEAFVSYQPVNAILQKWYNLEEAAY